MLYFFAITLAAIGGVLIGIVATSIFYTYVRENEELYDESDWFDK